MTALARALGASSKNFLIKIESFHSNRNQDSITWLEEFEQTSKAN